MKVLTPKQIIDNGRTRIEVATCPVALLVVWDQALGSLHALYELGLIAKSTWRKLHREFDTLGERRAEELARKGGVQ